MAQCAEVKADAGYRLRQYLAPGPGMMRERVPAAQGAREPQFLDQVGIVNQSFRPRAQVPMKFLILTQYFPPEIGGPQTRLAAMSRELVRLGHEVEIVTALPNYPRGQIFPEYRGSFYRLESLGG